MERNKLARQIIDTCLEMTRLGLNQGTAGNVSVRYQDGMLITPTGITYEKLTESHIVFIDGNGKHEEGKLPSSEWRFHMAAYQSSKVCTSLNGIFELGLDKKYYRPKELNKKIKKISG